MWDLAKRVLTGLENRIIGSDALSMSERIRNRMVMIAVLAFAALGTVNLVGMSVIYGELTWQHAFHAATALSLLGFIPLLRFTRNPAVFGYMIMIAAPGAVFLSAIIGHGDNPTLYGVGTPYMPYLLVSVVYASLIGTRLTAIGYVLVCTGLLIGMFLSNMPQAAAGGYLVANSFRLLLGCTSLVLTAMVMIPVGETIYNVLDSLEEAVDRAQTAEQARADFLATMSHEIRTPLNGILAMSDMLARASLPESEKRCANLIQVSAESLMSIINEILDLAKLEDGSVEIESEPFDVRALLDSTSALFEAKAKEQSLWIGWQASDDLPTHLIGDAPHLRQVLNNLVSNALKFTQDGGVRLCARLIERQDSAASVQFYVQDTGVGIAPEDQARVFDRYAQSDSAKMTTAKGTGLGLAICRELTSAMGGTLRLTSEVGKGTVFYFTLTLPVAASDQALQDVA